MGSIKLGILASTNATDLEPILSAIEQGELTQVSVEILITNKADCGAVDRARRHGIKDIWVDPKRFDTREAYDQEVAKILEEHQVDLVLMIGYMRIVTADFVKRFTHRILNVHPSLLPAFGGGMDKNVHEEVLKSGVKISGCTIHLVTESVDGGPILYQKAVTVEDEDTADSLKDKVQAEEGKGFVEVLKLFSRFQLVIEGQRTRFRGRE